MQVLSPVGTFPLKITHASLRGRRPTFEAAMGAWRSEVTLDRGDLPLAAGALAALALAFAAGRLSAS